MLLVITEHLQELKIISTICLHTVKELISIKHKRKQKGLEINSIPFHLISQRRILMNVLWIFRFL